MTTYEQTQKVNGLVREAFGENFDGTLWMDHLSGICKSPIFMGLIGARGKFFIPWIFPNYKFVGRFTQGDGSEIEVDAEHRSQAERYAELYQQLTGKPTKVSILQPPLEDRFDHAYVD